MLKNYTISELVDQVNKRLKNEQDFTNKQDNRISETITERKVRDMLTKNLISKGIKEGKSIYFDELHIEQILEIKKLQVQGLNERVLRSYGTTANVTESAISLSEEDNNLKASAISELNNIALSMQGSKMAINGKAGDPLNQYLSDKALKKELFIGSSSLDLLTGTQKYRDLHKQSVKSYMEYPLDDSGSLTLKVESGYKPKNIEEILEKIKQIIGE